MDAVHNIPYLVQHWDKCDEDLLRGMLEDFDAKYNEPGQGLAALYDHACGVAG
ncbi:MAG: hypothetical protein HOV80_28540 [Polyangiaceae bacterium]|nr:hypothetical protein [Polyangiaceae bacterium]